MNLEVKNLKYMKDETLIEETDAMVKQERELLTSVLHRFREIERRRLFSALKYKSLYDMVVRRYHYSEDEAYRRIKAMQLLNEIPEMEAQVASGELSLTHLNLAQKLFRQEKKTAQEFSKEQKLEVLNEIAGKSTRKAQSITLTFSSSKQPESPDSLRPIADNRLEVTFCADESLSDKVSRLKAMTAHRQPDVSLGELFNQLCDLGLNAWDPAKTAAPRKRCVINLTSQAQIRRDVFRRAENKCGNCQSQYALESDHRTPRALGGSSKATNLRALCRSCNQRAAIEAFGIQKMQNYLEPIQV